METHRRGGKLSGACWPARPSANFTLAPSVEIYAYNTVVGWWSSNPVTLGGCMSHDSCLMCGLSLILVPTIVYGGLTVLGVVTGGAYGAPSPQLSDQQTMLYRAGHAHAGVLTILALLCKLQWILHVSRLVSSGRRVLPSSLFRCLFQEDFSERRIFRHCAGSCIWEQSF